MTNGEKLVKAFPDIELYKKMHGGIQIDFDSVWWNAEYKEPTTKNDLGVDAVSRQAVLDLIADYDLSMGQVVRGIHALPLITPQEPKTGHWTYICNSSVNGLKIVECSECGKRTYGSGNYCPNCGSYNGGASNGNE